MDVSNVRICSCLLLTHDQRFIETNLLIICCCLPTLRRFFKHVAPRLIGESSDSRSFGDSKSHKLRTRDSTRSKPKRNFDTLMNTVDDNEDKDSIPLELRAENKRTGQGRLKADGMGMKADDDSEEAILFERTVQVTYESAENQAEHDQTHVGRVWAA